MDLATGRVITRPKVTVIPVTDTIITRVEEMANKQGIKTVKFLNRKRQQLFNNIGLTAGVVHEHEEHNEERESESKNEDEEDYELDIEDIENMEHNEIENILDDDEREKQRVKNTNKNNATETVLNAVAQV